MQSFTREFQIQRDTSLSAQRRVRARITSDALDRFGDIVRPDGGDLAGWVATGCPVIRDHDPSKPVASAVAETIQRSDAAIDLDVQWPPAGASSLADETWALIQAGTLNSFSIGASVQESKPLPSGGLEFVRWSLNEVSAVTVPANTDAVVLERSADTGATQMREVQIPKPEQAPAVRSSKNAINREYSVLRALNGAAAGTIKGLEAEVHDEICRSHASDTRGVRVPWGALTRAGSIGTANLGGDLASEQWNEMMWKSPAAMSEVLGTQQLGLTSFTSSEYTLKLPKQLTQTTSQWIALDGTASADSDITVGATSVTPKHLACNLSAGRSVQVFQTHGTGSSWEGFMRENMREAIARDATAGILFGDGTSNAPNGLFKTAAITTTDHSDAAGTPQDILALKGAMMDLWKESQVGTGEDEFRFLTHRSIYDQSRFYDWVASAYVPWLQADTNAANARAWFGVNVITSGHVPYSSGTPDTSNIYAYKARYGGIVGWGGGPDVIIDPYSGADSGNLRVVMFVDVNCAPLCAGTDFAHGLLNVKAEA